MQMQPVIWSEGLLLTPQHFQQQERYLLGVCSSRHESSGPHAFGFRELQFDAQLLRQGKIGLLKARGIMPDLTPFDMPCAHVLPAPVDAGNNVRENMVYLALPLRGHSGSGRSKERTGPVRINVAGMDVHDDYSQDVPVQHIDVGHQNFHLLIGENNRGGFSCLPIARIRDVSDDGSVLLDENFIPPCLSIQVAAPLTRFTTEIAELVRQQATALAARLCGESGSSHAYDLQLLLVFNRSTGFLGHLARQSGQHHPYDVYIFLLQLASELATFKQKGMLPPALPDYHHADLQQTFDPLQTLLRQLLQRTADGAAQPIPMVSKGHGIHVAILNDFLPANTTRLILAVSAELGVDQIRSRFPAAAKLAPTARIRQLVNLQLPGMKLNPLAAPPRQITFDGTCCYFELDRSAPWWQELQACGSLALHVADGMPGLATMLWMLNT